MTCTLCDSAPPKATELNLRRFHDFMDVASAALSTWVERLSRAERLLEKEACFDAESRAPLNEAAMLKELLSMAVEEHLKWAVTTISQAQLLSGDPPPARASGAFPLGLPGSPEHSALATLVRLGPKAARAQLRALYNQQTSSEQRLLHLLDAGCAAMVHWVADVKQVSQAYVRESGDRECSDPAGSRAAKGLFIQMQLEWALDTAQNALSLARSSDSFERRDHDPRKPPDA